MKVEQFYHNNQFVIFSGEKTIFQSYNSTIAIIEDGELTLGYNWDYSKTTSKHLYMFLEEYYYTHEIYKALHKSNKRDAIRKLINSGYINYDENLY